MPRPPADTRFRRFMMQSIMWVVLALTVGAAALVSARSGTGKPVKLTDLKHFDGFSLRLPQGWQTVSGGLISGEMVLQSSKSGASMTIDSRRTGLADLFGMAANERFGVIQESIAFGDRHTNLYLLEEVVEGVEVHVWSAMQALPDGRRLRIRLETMTEMSPQLLAREAQLMRDVCGSFKPD